ncbi:MAG: glycerate kinase [Spirochaetes bacterium]|nr:glycerate kinase [Spirochaetota bacterium]
MSQARDDVRAILAASIAAVDPASAVASHLCIENERLLLYSDDRMVHGVDFSMVDRIFVVGAGKATASMALAVERMLGDWIDAGCISVKDGYTESLSKIECIEASHPVPDERGMAGARKILDLLRQAGERDLVISLISGGASALMPLPPEQITLDEKRATTSILLKCGAAIDEINTVRKHLSLVKGGNLARAAKGATVINLMMSDVVGDYIDVIGSGPFTPDRSTFKDALGVLENYGIESAMPSSVADRIRAGAGGALEENPKAGDPSFSKVFNVIIASNIIALKAAQRKATELGCRSIILSSMIEGDTRDAALWHSRIAREIRASSNPAPPPACIISGGETTVAVRGDGLGGRNMEFALHAAQFIDGLDGCTIASIGTDGTDGPTDAAGAIIDGRTAEKAREKGLDIQDYIARNDSYHFHEKLGGLIITGPTNTNVMDVRIILVR